MALTGRFCQPRLIIYTHQRWINQAIFTPEKEQIINTLTVLKAIQNDTFRAAERLVYRGSPLPHERIIKWKNQFPENLQPVALHLINRINAKYFITQEEFYSIIKDLIRKSGVRRGRKVTFCKWQALSKSSPRCTHVMKNLAKWKCKIDIDLTKKEELWTGLPKDKDLLFILADDFVGSGDSLMKLCIG